MSEDEDSPYPFIGLECDAKRQVFRVIVPLPDGSTHAVLQSRKDALGLYRSLGQMLFD